MLKVLTFICVFVLIGISSQSHGDDTELYVFETATDAGARPKVLIIFDNSGSMDTKENVPDPDYIPPADYNSDYNPSTDYSGSGIKNIVYFSTSSSANLESLLSSNQRFYSKYNGCHQSWAPLADIGFFKGRVSEYYSNNWKALRTTQSLTTARAIDCWEDIAAEDPINSSDYGKLGFPKDGFTNPPYTVVSGASDKNWDSAIKNAKKTTISNLSSVTLYSENYLLWNKLIKNGNIPIVSKKRIDIAKKAISDVIKTTPSVDFGLAVFNTNYNSYGKDGGRIVSGIRDMSPGTTPGIAARNNILTKINLLNPETNTPLCETLFEAYRYLSGGAIMFGHQDNNSPSWDVSVESGSDYMSPLKICTDMAYVIYITDGAPNYDNAANASIVSITAKANELGNYTAVSAKNAGGQYESNYLPALASYMYQNDLVNKKDDNGDNPLQNVRTFTIGFSSGADDAAPLLIETAKRGGGKYFAAQDSLQLTNALSDALSSILEIDSSFTSPSIASNNFDRTQTFDSAYYAMFLPGKGPRWTGNLKKLKVNSSGTLIDAKGSIAIGDNGNIKKEACTFWTNCSGGTDGNQVEIGGVTQMLEGLTKRTVLSNTASGNGLEELSIANAANGSNADLAAYMSIDETELDSTFKWILGTDVDDEDGDNSTDKRKDIMGDPLHSKPLAINFGTSAAPDIRVLLGTNHGLLHMFKDSGVSVDETWAFMPYELLPNVPKLRKNLPGGHYVYGMDASPVAYVKSGANGNKPIDVWVFAGMRRGGSSYYALNVTLPDAPSLMWTINTETYGFSELGQTWAEPIITLIPGHSTPVLIFGGGYDVSYDSTPSSTPSGRNVYIVDAKLGTLLHTFGPSAGTKATVLPGIIDSIPNAVAVLDSNNDGVTDRIYATDTGGNVWRMDLPSKDDKTWTAYKFASLGGDLAADRRFFAEPVVAQTAFNNITEVAVVDPVSGSKAVTKNYQNVPYDAIAIGSGNRPTPLSKSTEDMYYVLQDRNVITKSYGGSGNPVAPAAITLGNLYNVTAAPPKTEAENIEFGKKLGWYYDYPTAGEKSLTASLIVDGKVYFTSFVPPSQSVSDTVCTVSGLGRLYVFDLHKGTRTLASVYYELGERVPDTPQIVIPTPESGKDPYIYIIGVGKGDKRDDGEYSGTINVGSGLGVNKIYYHIDDN